MGVEQRKRDKEESIVHERQQAVERYQSMILEWKEDAVTQQEQRTRMQTFLAEEQEFGASVQLMRKAEKEEVPELMKFEERTVYPNTAGFPPSKWEPSAQNLPPAPEEDDKKKGKDDKKKDKDKEKEGKDDKKKDDKKKD